MKRRIVVFFCLWVGLVCGAKAQELEVFAGGYDPGSELTGTDFDNGALFGFRIGHPFLPAIGAEVSYTVVNNLVDKQKNFEGKAQLISGNLLAQFAVGKLVPFGTLGIGGLVSGDSNQFLDLKKGFIWNAGGGVKIPHLVGPLGLRLDVRYYK
ncbi:MAG: hypothetical protein HY315_09265, partial [Acidobacteria bacterium]|nr:hypothetical protein [Acidobacteriota bacterium]